jgi:HAD superfamily hydrolase (TIGR01509 family)
MPVEAVIFDMDGVLVDSEVYWGRSREAFARDIGKVWTDEDQRLAMGRSTVEWAQVMQERLSLDWTIEAIIDDMFQRVMNCYEEKMPLRPGALEAVHLAASAYPVALASGSPTPIIQHVMALTGLDKVFLHIVYGDDQAHGKPAPDIYLEAACRLGIAPEVAVGIEDSANGVRALKNAGMTIIAAPSPDFPLPAEIMDMAHVVIDSLEDFTLELVRLLG